MLDGPVVEAIAPSAVKAVVSKTTAPAVPGQEAGQNGPETIKIAEIEEGPETGITAEEVRELASVVEQAEKDNNVFPESNDIALRAIATKGDLAENLELSGQASREKAINAPKEGEGALTDEQRQRQIAFGFDQEIGGLQIKLSRIKNKEEKKKISERIANLKQEKSKTGIKENQLNDLAELFAIDEKSAKLIDDHIKNETPMVAVEKILELAAVDKDVRQAVLSKLIESGQFSEDKIRLLEEHLISQAKRKTAEKGVKTAGKIGLGVIIVTLMTMYSGLKEKKQGMG